MRTCPTCLEAFDPETSFCPRDGTPLRVEDEAGDPLVGRVLAERYLVLDRLGEGGFGTVYRVRDTRLDDVEALKVLDRRRLPSDRGQEVWERFTREAKVLRRLGKLSDHIVGATNLVHDLKEDLYCYAMEYVEGENLAEVIAREGPLEPPRAVRLLRQLCSALQTAHAEGIVHRDLKLENVMVSRQRGGELLRVLDFGIAKVLSQGSLTDLSVGVPGTPGYGAPEQLENPKDVGPRTDLFPMGVILFAMLTGREPWTGSAVSEPTSEGWALIRATMMSEPKLLEEFRQGLPKGFQPIVTKLLQKNPENRFESAAALDAALAGLEQKLAGGRGIGQAARKAAPAAIAAAAVVAGWILLRPVPALSFDEFSGALERQEVDYVRVKGAALRVGLRGESRSGRFQIPMEGRRLQAVMGRVASAAVPVRTSGRGRVRFEGVEGASGTAIRTPVVTLASEELEGCAPCGVEEEVSLVSGWYEVRAASDGWALDSLQLTVGKGYQAETVPVAEGSRLFVPAGVDVTVRAAVSITAAGRRARAEAQRAAAAERARRDSLAASRRTPAPADLKVDEREVRPTLDLGATRSLAGAAGAAVGVEAEAVDVSLDALASDPARWVGRVVRVTDAPASTSAGRQAFYLYHPRTPVLVRLHESLVAAGQRIPTGSVTVVGSVRALDDEVLRGWLEAGAITSAQRPLVEFATHFVEARVVRRSGS